LKFEFRKVFKQKKDYKIARQTGKHELDFVCLTTRGEEKQRQVTSSGRGLEFRCDSHISGTIPVRRDAKRTARQPCVVDVLFHDFVERKKTQQRDMESSSTILD
jgi:hypothetical protein